MRVNISRIFRENLLAFIVVASIIAVFLIVSVSAADPEGPDTTSLVSNVTKANVSAYGIGIAGGRIATFNFNSTVKNTRWKGFVGNVTGKFTLDDASGETLYDWTLSAITGRVYATRNSSTLSWSNINCSNITQLEDENYNLNHTNADDNITKTFNATFNYTTNMTISGAHDPFWVGSVYITSNSCPTLNTYESDAAQYIDFEEMALFEGTSMVYATILESDETGFDGISHDFQMIVPESALPSIDATAYYLYVEIGT